MRRSVARVAARALAGARQPFSAAATVPKSESAAAAEWARLAREGVRVNPCNSNHHPAALAGVAKPQAGNVQVSVQAAYDPLGMCFACGALCCAVRTEPSRNRTLTLSRRPCAPDGPPHGQLPHL
jgi:hypothetical protein